MKSAMQKVEVYLGHKISYCSFWDESYLIFWPKNDGSGNVYPEKFKTLEEAKEFIRNNDDTPENTLMKYLQN